MRIATFAGMHASGKTSIILKTIALLNGSGLKAGVMKLDCLLSSDDSIYRNAGIPVIKYISGNVCPDHYFADSLPEVCKWGLENHLDVLITESAGLCGRCAPHLKKIPAVCIIDCLSGITAPEKIGPMLRLADYIVITKGDLISPAEREVFFTNVRLSNRHARISFINGLSGQGAYRLASYIRESSSAQSIEGRTLRFTMPSAVCTYCAGQIMIKDVTGGARIKKLPEVQSQ